MLKKLCKDDSRWQSQSRCVNRTFLSDEPCRCHFEYCIVPSCIVVVCVADHYSKTRGRKRKKRKRQWIRRLQRHCLWVLLLLSLGLSGISGNEHRTREVGIARHRRLPEVHSNSLILQHNNRGFHDTARVVIIRRTRHEGEQRKLRKKLKSMLVGHTGTQRIMFS